MSNDLENLSYDELAGKARGAGEATRDANRTYFSEYYRRALPKAGLN